VRPEAAAVLGQELPDAALHFLPVHTELESELVFLVALNALLIPFSVRRKAALHSATVFTHSIASAAITGAACKVCVSAKKLPVCKAYDIFKKHLN